MLGLLAAYMLDVDLVLGLTYGAGTGVGAVAAWSVNLQPFGGGVAGAIVGLSLGVLLAPAAPRDDRGVLAPERPQAP